MGKLVDLVGQKFGRLAVLSLLPKDGPDRRWLCRCDCGASIITKGKTLRAGESTSCGCRRREEFISRNTKHGGAHTKTFKIWTAMKQRCENQRCRQYADYGGRGIRVCERWAMYANFVADMGEKPDGMSLDRINNDGHYEPGNCRWATHAQQARNTRRNIQVEFNGKTQTLTDWAKSLGIHPQSLYSRIYKHGWPLERALTLPPDTAHRNGLVNGRRFPLAPDGTRVRPREQG
jgi:hypothetical protein